MDTPSPAPVALPSSIRPFQLVAQIATICQRNKRTGRTQILTATPERRIDQDTPVGAPAAAVRNYQVHRRLLMTFASADYVVTIVNKAKKQKHRSPQNELVVNFFNRNSLGSQRSVDFRPNSSQNTFWSCSEAPDRNNSKSKFTIQFPILMLSYPVLNNLYVLNLFREFASDFERAIWLRMFSEYFCWVARFIWRRPFSDNLRK